MDKQTLQERIDGELGSTQLTLSDRTKSDYLDVILKGITSDEQVTDDYIKGHVAILKSLDGNLHADVASETNKNKTKWEADFKAQWEKDHPQQGQQQQNQQNPQQPNADNPLLKKIEELEKSMADMQKASERATAEKNKAEILASVKKSFEDKLKESNLEANAYILKNSLGELSVPEKDADVRDLAAKLEKRYYDNLKAAGIVGQAPPARGGRQPGKGNQAVSDYWKRKQMREGWGIGKAKD